jgi:hypothetical protein
VGDFEKGPSNGLFQIMVNKNGQIIGYRDAQGNLIPLQAAANAIEMYRADGLRGWDSTMPAAITNAIRRPNYPMEPEERKKWDARMHGFATEIVELHNRLEPQISKILGASV